MFLVRQQPRYPLEVAAEARDGDRCLTGKTRNVSLSGCSIVGRLPLTVGREHILRLQTASPANDNATLELPAVVVWCSRTENGFETGLKFKSSCAGAREALDALITRAAAAAPPLPDPTAARGDTASDGELSLLEGFVLSREGRPDPTVRALCVEVVEQFWCDRPEPLPFPQLATQLLDTLEDPAADLGRIVELVERDAAVTAALLKAANSPLFRRGPPVPDVAAAVVKLGLRTVGQLASAAASHALFDLEARAAQQLHAPRWKALFQQALTAAFSAAALAARLKLPAADRAFSAGLLHDVGKTLALRALSTLQLAGRVPGTLKDEIVDEVLERTHVELGVEMHTAWSLPAHLSLAAAHHHDPVVADTPELALVHVVRVVSGLAELHANPGARSVVPLVAQSAHVLKLDKVRMRITRSAVDEVAERVASLSL